MAWTKLGSTTLTSYSETIQYNVTSNDFMMFMIHTIPDSTVHTSFQFNDDTGTSYNNNYATNGGTNYTDTNQTKLRISPDASTVPELFIGYIVNKSSEEKLIISHKIQQNTAGAGNAPNRLEVVGKWTNTSSQISNIKLMENNQAGGFTTGSNFTTLGSDGVEELNVQDGAVYYETDTNKEYVLYNNTWTEV